MERHRVTVGFGNPDLLEALARSDGWSTVDLSSLRIMITGGAPVPERLIPTFFDRGVTLLQGYGLSEAAPVVLLLDAESALRKVGSAGRPPLLVDVRIVGRDGADVGPDLVGELLVRGPNVMAGYWRRPEDTRAALSPDGWLRTGDAARMDAEGFVWIVDRVAAGFMTGGGMIYPGDIERVLLAHPAVMDAGVVGIPEGEGNDEGGVPGAMVVLVAAARATEDDLLAFARERLDPYQVPASIVFADALPRNSVGKLLRHELRERLSAPSAR